MPCQCSGKKTNDFPEIEPVFTGKKENLITVLQKAQDIYGWLPVDLLFHISRRLGVKPAKVMGVATFYTQFKTKPAGRHMILLCRGTACHVNGSADIEQAIKDHLKAEEGEITQDGLFSYINVACLGCCSLSPAMMIDNKTYGNLTGEGTVKILKEIARKEEGK
jgi:NADH-quinone oxidoreductase subunit E